MTTERWREGKRGVERESAAAPRAGWFTTKLPYAHMQANAWAHPDARMPTDAGRVLQLSAPITVTTRHRPLKTEESAVLEDRRLDFLVTSCNNARKGCSLLKVIHLGSFRFDYAEAALYTSNSKQLFFFLRCVCENPQAIFSLFTTPHLNCGTINYLSKLSLVFFCFVFATNKMTPKETKRTVCEVRVLFLFSHDNKWPH